MLFLLTTNEKKKGFWLLLALASSSSSSSDISFCFRICFFRFSIGDKELGFGSSFPWRMLCAEEDEMKERERENSLVHDDQEKRRIFCWAEREIYISYLNGSTGKGKHAGASRLCLRSAVVVRNSKWNRIILSATPVHTFIDKRVSTYVSENFTGRFWDVSWLYSWVTTTTNSAYFSYFQITFVSFDYLRL